MRRIAMKTELGSAYQTARAAERAVAEAQSSSAAAQHAYEGLVAERVVAVVLSNGLARLPPETVAAFLNRWAEEVRGAVERSLGEIESSSVSSDEPRTINAVVRTSVNVGAKKKSTLITSGMQWNGRRGAWTGRCSPKTISDLRTIFGTQLEVREEGEVNVIDTNRGSPAETAESDAGSAMEPESNVSPTPEAMETRSKAEASSTDSFGANEGPSAAASDATSVTLAPAVPADFARRTLPRRPGLSVFATGVLPTKSDLP